MKLEGFQGDLDLKLSSLIRVENEKGTKIAENTAKYTQSN